MREILFCDGCLRAVFPFFLEFFPCFFSISLYNVLFGILLKAVGRSLFRTESFARELACSFPYIPMWALTL